MKVRSKILSPFGILASVALLLGSGGTIILVSTNQVSSDGLSTNRWEPSSAAGTTWAHTWLETTGSQGITSFASALTGSGWSPGFALTAGNGQPTQDVNIAWDPVRSRFVLAALDNSINHSVWYAVSTDSTGTSWNFTAQPFVGGVNLNGLGAANWDYPSISVDGSGRVIIGAVYFIGNTQQNGYWTAVATDGANFTTPSRVGSDPGRQSRVVATSSLFEAFIPIQNAQGLPTLINRWESSDGQNWSGPLSIGMGSFGAPWNNTPVGTSSTILFYAPLLAATGYTNGLWAVAFQANNNGYNNVVICTSDRGCGWVNAANVDEFLSGVSVSGDQAYWVHYLTYSAIGSRNPPLLTQALYFPSGGSVIGATINTGIDPTSWLFTSNRCVDNNGNPVPCYAAGDFNTIASNPFAAATTPFIQRSAHINDLFQSFVEDPQAAANVANFKPNFVPIPFGADLSALAVHPPGLNAYAPPPGSMIGAPVPAAHPAQ